MSGAVDEDVRRSVARGRETLGAMLSAAQTHLQKVAIVFLIGFLGSFYALWLYVWDRLKTDLFSRLSADVARETSVNAITPFDVPLLQAKISLFVGGLVALPVLLYYSRDALDERGYWPHVSAGWKVALIVRRQRAVVRRRCRVRLLRLLPADVRLPRGERRQRRVRAPLLDRLLGAVHPPALDLLRDRRPTPARDDRALAHGRGTLRDLPREVEVRHRRRVRLRRAVLAAGPLHPGALGGPHHRPLCAESRVHEDHRHLPARRGHGHPPRRGSRALARNRRDPGRRRRRARGGHRRRLGGSHQPAPVQNAVLLAVGPTVRLHRPAVRPATRGRDRDRRGRRLPDS